MSIKYLDDEDYFECSGGLFPARINDPKNTYLTVNGKKYLTHYDTATKSPDFTCRWAVILAVAAAVFFALLASNPVGWAILAGIAVGVGIGMAMCGVMMAMGRKWIDPHTDFVIEGAKFTLTTDKHMVCALGGEIRYSSQVKTPLDAFITGAHNLGLATLEGIVYGYAAYGGASLFTTAGRSAFLPNMVQGFKASWGKWGLVARAGFAGENVAYNSYSGNYTNEDGSYNYGAAALGGATTFGGDAYAYYNLGNKIHNGEDLSISDVTVPLTMPFAFVGANIQQTKANNQIPRPLREGSQNLSAKVKGLFKSKPVRTSDSWQQHEDFVTEELIENNPRSTVGEQITLDVEFVDTNGNIVKVRIRIDNLHQLSDGSYQLTDAKFSSANNLTDPNFNIRNTFTENQKIAYDAIGSGNATVTPAGGNASGMGLTPGQPIIVNGTTYIAVNTPNGIVYRAYP